MRFISIVTTSENLVTNIETFPIFEDQLSADVIEQAEAFFKKEVLKYDSNMNDEDIEFFLEEGYADINGTCICVAWS
jgi:hypothetical protein